MKFHIISPTRLQVDVYDMNLQLNFVALFFVSQSCCYNQFFHQKTLFYNFLLEDEVEKLLGDHRGLVHSDQALRLSRLMVRAETMEQRIMLLKILQVFDNQFHVSLVESLSKKVGRIKSCWKQELLFKWKTWHRVACVDFYSLCMDLLKISMYGLNKSLYKQAKLLENSI